MDYNNDIVARLRLYAERQKQTRSTVLGLLLSDSADEIERLHKERDEARRMYLASACSDDEIIPEMKRNGWDCFKENSDV